MWTLWLWIQSWATHLRRKNLKLNCMESISNLNHPVIDQGEDIVHDTYFHLKNVTCIFIMSSLRLPIILTVVTWMACLGNGFPQPNYSRLFSRQSETPPAGALPDSLPGAAFTDNHGFDAAVAAAPVWNFGRSRNRVTLIHIILAPSTDQASTGALLSRVCHRSRVESTSTEPRNWCSSKPGPRG
jgi:hypothetical protein